MERKYLIPAACCLFALSACETANIIAEAIPVIRDVESPDPVYSVVAPSSFRQITLSAVFEPGTWANEQTLKTFGYGPTPQDTRGPNATLIDIPDSSCTWIDGNTAQRCTVTFSAAINNTWYFQWHYERVGGDLISQTNPPQSFQVELVASQPGGNGNPGSNTSVCDNEDVKIVSRGGGIMGGGSNSASISADGRYIAFSTPTGFALSTDTNGNQSDSHDIYVWDRSDNSLQHISKGNVSNGRSISPAISADGNFVAFVTSTPFDGANEPNAGIGNLNQDDVYLWSRQTNSLEIVSRGNGLFGGGSHSPSISGDGQFVAFATPVTFDPSTDVNNDEDVYVWSKSDGSLQHISQSSSGVSNGRSFSPDISANGNFVAFVTTSPFDGSNEGNTNPSDPDDIYLWSRSLNDVQIVSRDNGLSGGGSHSPSISADGRYVAFATPVTFDLATDLNSNRPDSNDIYIWDRNNASLSLVSKGNLSTGRSIEPDIADDGNTIVFTSSTSFDLSQENNSPGENLDDIYMWRRSESELILVSRANGIMQGGSRQAVVSEEGEFVALTTPAPFIGAQEENTGSFGNEDVYTFCVAP